MLYRSEARTGRRRATIKRADTKKYEGRKDTEHVHSARGAMYTSEMFGHKCC